MQQKRNRKETKKSCGQEVRGRRAKAKRSAGHAKTRLCEKKSNRRSCGEYAVKNVDREDLSTVSGMKNADCIQINTICGYKRRFVIFL